MSVLLNKRMQGATLPKDMVFVIYGDPGSGKTTLASTFPKSKDKKMLVIDILEGGTSVIASKDLDNTDVISISNFKELEEIFTDLYNGYSLDDDGKKVELNYQTIVIDTVTNLEFIMKEYLKEINNKSDMTLQLWGKTKDSSENMYNLLKKLYQETGCIVVAIAHAKKIDDEENPGFNKVIPSLMASASVMLAAKASYVWYTKVETEHISNNDGTVKKKSVFNTYIDAHPYLVTKCRKPKSFTIVSKVKDLDYPKFKKNVLDKI